LTRIISFDNEIHIRSIHRLLKCLFVARIVQLGVQRNTVPTSTFF
jgi:hypothetical protein